RISQKLNQLSNLISEEGAAHIVANELGVKIFEVPKDPKIKDLISGMKEVTISARIVRKYELREFNRDGREGKVANILIGDETGVMRAVMWNSMTDSFNQLNEKDTITIESGYIKENNGRKEIHLNDKSKIKSSPSSAVGQAQPQEATRKKISELTATDTNVEVLGTIVQVYDIRFFDVCPQCNKRLRDTEGTKACLTHGKVEPLYNYVMNLFLDDGTDSVRCVLWKEQTQTLLGVADGTIQQYRLSPDTFEQAKSDLLGEMIIIRGRINNNPNYDRVELIADHVDPKPNPGDEMKNLGGDLSEDDTAQLLSAVKATNAELRKDEPSEDLVTLDDIEEMDFDKDSSE
ncbi:MAG: OB-fold nucleic acid binding domain-containing protein, partial [Nanoarchaeota archaeon]